MSVAGAEFEKFKISSAGARALLRSPGVRADMQRRADAVLRAAQPHTDAELRAEAVVGKGRAGATVFGVPLREEAARRVLGSAIDAAGNG